MTTFCLNSRCCECNEEQKKTCKANVKKAWVWVFPAHPYTVGYPGIAGGDLFFSSPEKFKELLGRDPDDTDTLAPVWVPPDFDNWDYMPENY